MQAITLFQSTGSVPALPTARTDGIGLSRFAEKLGLLSGQHPGLAQVFDRTRPEVPGKPARARAQPQAPWSRRRLQVLHDDGNVLVRIRDYHLSADDQSSLLRALQDAHQNSLRGSAATSVRVCLNGRYVDVVGTQPLRLGSRSLMALRLEENSYGD